MDKVQEGATVQIHYTGMLKDGAVFDSSQERGPLEVKVGEGQIIPGLEQSLMGMEEGETKRAVIPPDQGYGDRNEELVVNVPKDKFPEEPKVGQQFQASQPDGGKTTVWVTEVTDAQVTVDANHPLAGRELVFDVQVVKIAS